MQYVIIQIGELITRLSEDFINENTQIHWQTIKNMRNIHAHNYEHIDKQIMWITLTERIPS